MFGLELPEQAAHVLERTGLVTTDEELAYFLLFVDSLMIAPLSYFGLKKNSGFMRITCSADDNELQEMMNRLENRLTHARIIKKTTLMEQIYPMLPHLELIDKHTFDIVMQKIKPFLGEELNCFILKKQIYSLEKIRELVADFLGLMDERKSL